MIITSLEIYLSNATGTPAAAGAGGRVFRGGGRAFGTGSLVGSFLLEALEPIVFMLPDAAIGGTLAGRGSAAVLGGGGGSSSSSSSGTFGRVAGLLDLAVLLGLAELLGLGATAPSMSSFRCFAFALLFASAAYKDESYKDESYKMRVTR